MSHVKSKDRVAQYGEVLTPKLNGGYNPDVLSCLANVWKTVTED